MPAELERRFEAFCAERGLDRAEAGRVLLGLALGDSPRSVALRELEVRAVRLIHEGWRKMRAQVLRTAVNVFSTDVDIPQSDATAPSRAVLNGASRSSARIPQPTRQASRVGR